MDNLSAQAPELCHQAFVKTLGRMINRHPNWSMTAMLRHAQQNLVQFMAANPSFGEHPGSGHPAFAERCTSRP